MDIMTCDWFFVEFTSDETWQNLKRIHVHFSYILNYCHVENEIIKYTTSQKFLNSKIAMFFKEFSSAHQACIYLIQNTAKTVIL